MIAWVRVSVCCVSALSRPLARQLRTHATKPITIRKGGTESGRFGWVRHGVRALRLGEARSQGASVRSRWCVHEVLHQVLVRLGLARAALARDQERL